MRLISNKTWMQIHLYVSLFFIPMALIYAITGSLYIFDIRQNAGAEISEIKVFQDIPKGEERAVMLATLEANGLKIPKKTEVRLARNSIIMGTLKYQVILSKDKDGGYILRSINRNLYGVLLLLHKSAGKYYFDILAVGFSIALVILYLSGLFMTAFCKKDRKGSLITIILGFAITALAVYYSI
ncbi:hypothetical protein LS72_004095 [Helicobacter apodemus]|uniref:Integral membrane protein n=1 Tax=Helicobacter apodemus TaxID=135569 RepID=A0A4U8UEU6_9HELI|nr:hypothetical protein [Helicobacter apodemus]MDE6958796.1 hypothetical protein [Helicobacter apodemus]TLE16253.1 hypothetical protein LS72_004095 [Helicobacter apodemus]